MNCKYLARRYKKYKPYFYCRYKKEVIAFDLCKNCSNFDLKKNKPISKRSSKQNKLEKDRDKNLNKKGYCQYCGQYSERLDPHEIYGGSNRKRSIINGFVILLCRNCHNNEKIILDIRKKTQKKYEKNHTREEFIELIGKNYL